MTTHTARSTRTIRPISPRQLTLIEDLHRERGVEFDRAAISALNAVQASELIDGIMALPRPQRAVVTVDEGFYVTADGSAYKVQKTKDGARVYAKKFVVSGGRASWDYAPGGMRGLVGLTPMTAQDAARIGLQSKFCVRCCKPLGGETLSAKVSAVIGFGETCARHEGWDYPTGVAAQREFLAASAAA